MRTGSRYNAGDYDDDRYGNNDRRYEGRYSRPTRPYYNNYNNNNNNRDTARLCKMLEDKEWREWEKEDKERRRREEEDERKVKEAESEQRRKDHEAMMDRMNEKQEAFFRKLTSTTGQSAGPARGGKRGRSPSPTGSEDADYDSYKEALREKKKKGTAQTVRAPCNPKDWQGWKCDEADAKRLKTAICGSLKESEIKDMSLIELGEHLAAHNGTQKKEDLRDTFEAASGEEPPARWSKLDLVIGVAAAIFKR